MKKTPQLDLWCNEFGRSYLGRNSATIAMLRQKINVWAEIIRRLPDSNIESVLEVGSNIGLNLRALKVLLDTEFYAVEPFKEALDTLLADGIVDEDKAFCTSAFDMSMFIDNQIDLVFTCGVLIHIHPEDLAAATDEIVRITKKYIICVEYFADKEETIPYRGQENALFKRDFGTHYLDKYPNLSLVDYGFAWKRATGADNLTWWIFRKS